MMRKHLYQCVQTMGFRKVGIKVVGILPQGSASFTGFHTTNRPPLYGARRRVYACSSLSGQHRGPVLRA